jgi:EAL domain-containing protein (putative c-di-GMP-specific phosphodiesterase class I)
VNVSSRQLERPGLREAIVAALTTAQLPATALGIEITESALIRDVDLARDVFLPLHNLGVKLAIDDFGTGFSSLRRLRELPIDHLKVDGSFVAGLGDHPADSAIVKACVELARALGLASVAEAVETERQLELLAEMGCDVAQGFAIAPPLAPAALDEFLRGPAQRRTDTAGGRA